MWKCEHFYEIGRQCRNNAVHFVKVQGVWSGYCKRHITKIVASETEDSVDHPQKRGEYLDRQRLEELASEQQQTQ